MNYICRCKVVYKNGETEIVYRTLYNVTNPTEKIKLLREHFNDMYPDAKDIAVAIKKDNTVINYLE